MSRYEITISDGEKILVDHPTEGMGELMAELHDKDFIIFTEIKAGATTVPREVIVASSQITLIRAADSDSRQSSTFRPKR